MKTGAAVMDQTTAIEKPAERTPEIITTPEEFRSSLLRWQAKNLNILTPFSNISGLAPSYGIFSTVIQFDARKEAMEVYDGLPFLKKDEVALAKNGLRKIAEGLGISTRLEYISVGVIRHYWHVKAIAKYRGIDGAWIEREASMEWDLRDGSDRLKGWTGNQVTEGRKYGLRACETRAINAAIRECGCGIKQAYKREEVSKPFLAVRVALQPDMSDPDIKRIVTEHFVGATRELYAGTSQAGPVDTWADEPQTGGPRPVGSGSTAGAAASSAAQTGQAATTASSTSQPPTADQPPSQYAVRILDVKTYTGTSTSGKPYVKFGVIDSNGQEHATFSKTLRDRAEKAKASGEWVELTSEQNGQYTNLSEIAAAGQSQELPGLENL